MLPKLLAVTGRRQCLRGVRLTIGLRTYTNGQQGHSNHVVAMWSFTLTELTELPTPVWS